MCWLHSSLVRRGTEFDSRADLLKNSMGCWSNGTTPGLVDQANLEGLSPAPSAFRRRIFDFLDTEAAVPGFALAVRALECFAAQCELTDSTGKDAAMQTQKPEMLAGASLATEFDSSAQAGTELEPDPEQSEPDAETLVDQLVAAGEWPEPSLLEKIVDAGAAAVAPLISVVRTHPRGWPAEATLDHAATLLAVLSFPEAIPELIEVIRLYDEDSGDLAAQCLGSFGAIAFEQLLAFCCDPAVTGYPRTHAISAAIGAAGDDSSLRARLGDVLRPMLADAIERLRQSAQGSRSGRALRRIR